jgi:hypothetical protein
VQLRGVRDSCYRPDWRIRHKRSPFRFVAENCGDAVDKAKNSIETETPASLVPLR